MVTALFLQLCSNSSNFKVSSSQASGFNTPLLSLLAILILQRPVVSICTTRFNIIKLCILPTQCICVFRMVLTINSECFPKFCIWTNMNCLTNSVPWSFGNGTLGLTHVASSLQVKFV
jgi:hypothetical protein